MPPKLPVLSAEQIAAALDLAELEYEVPEWGTSVKLKAFTIDQRDQVLSACTEKDGQIDAKKLIRLLVVHGIAEPKLTLDIIANKSFAVVERIAQEVMKLNGMSKEKGPSAATVADVTFRQES
jgi:hypothetical protein